MEGLQQYYNRFYDVIMESVDDIEHVSKAKQIKLDENDKFPVFVVGLSPIISLQCVAFVPIVLNGIIESVKEDDNITLSNRLYGDFIDKNYKAAFIRNVKNKNDEGIVELVKKAVVEIIKLKNK